MDRDGGGGILDSGGRIFRGGGPGGASGGVDTIVEVRGKGLENSQSLPLQFRFYLRLLTPLPSFGESIHLPKPWLRSAIKKRIFRQKSVSVFAFLVQYVATAGLCTWCSDKLKPGVSQFARLAGFHDGVAGWVIEL